MKNEVLNLFTGSVCTLVSIAINKKKLNNKIFIVLREIFYLTSKY